MIHMQGAGFFRGEGTYQKTARFLATQADNVGVWGALPDGTLRRPNILRYGTGGLIGRGAHTQTLYSGGFADFMGRRANGTESIPTALLAGNVITAFRGSGYGATGFGSETAGILMQASENWTDIAQGSRMLFRTTPTGGIGLDNMWTISPEGHFLDENDNTKDIGISGANRPRRGYFATAVQIEADGAAGVTTGLCLTNQTLGAGGAATGSFSVNVNGVRRNVLYN